MSRTETTVAPEIPLFRQHANIIRDAVKVNLEGLTHEESLTCPQPAGSCANWILGHLTDSYEQSLPFLGQQSVLTQGALKRYRRGSPPLADRAEAWDFAELQQVWNEAATRMDSGVEELTSEAMGRRSNYFGGKSETTLAKFLNFIFFHQAYHAGQLGLLRRILGKEGAIP